MFRDKKKFSEDWPTNPVTLMILCDSRGFKVKVARELMITKMNLCNLMDDLSQKRKARLIINPLPTGKSTTLISS